MRRVASSNEFFDILDKIGNGKFVTIGYVTGANLNIPTIKKKNPLTNRMKGYPDYTIFGSEEEIGALVKISSYNFQYLNRQTVGKKYGEYKQSANVIRGNFGLDPIADKESYKQGTDWSPNGPELYKGSNADLQSHSYNPQNIYGVKPKGIIYAVNKEGHIIKALSQEQIIPYLKEKRKIDGVAALKKMNVEEERIEEYINQIEALKFKYINFESNSILWIAATINGEKIVYINDNLSRAVDEINIRPEDFRAIAIERYQVDLANLQEMVYRMNNKNKTIFRLTESELRSFIGESVKKILSELDWRTNDFTSGKSHKGWSNESQEGKETMNETWRQAPWDERDPIEDRDEYPLPSVSQPTEEGGQFKNNQGYSHFAVSKKSGKIINGWNYKDYDPSELRQFKKDYFDVDLIDYGFNPKDFRILSYKYLIRNGIDPNDNSNWANNDETDAEFVG